MKPAWDELMQTYAGHATVLIADVDCTADAGKSLCEQHGVQGYPTIKWGDPNALEDYEGRRNLDALKTFAADNLKPLCGPDNLDLCEEDQKAKIADLMALSASALDGEILKKETEIADAGNIFDTEVQKLQARYEELEKEKTEKQNAIKNGGLGLAKAVLAAKISAPRHGEL